VATVEELTTLILALPERERALVLENIQKSLPRHPTEVRLKADSRTLLEAIARANDFSIRGIEGIIAEAVFAIDILPGLKGWSEHAKPADAPFDFLLRRQARVGDVRLQFKMQRREKHVPLMASGAAKRRWRSLDTFFVVEVQKTRGGKTASGKKSRPYRFGEFDLLAVSLGASTGYWGDVAFTVANWLLPTESEPDAIRTLQPVNPAESDDWTRSFERAIEWLDSRKQRTIEG
jgi:hypothetical protein